MTCRPLEARAWRGHLLVFGPRLEPLNKMLFEEKKERERERKEGGERRGEDRTGHGEERTLNLFEILQILESQAVLIVDVLD